MREAEKLHEAVFDLEAAFAEHDEGMAWQYAHLADKLLRGCSAENTV